MWWLFLALVGCDVTKGGGESDPADGTVPTSQMSSTQSKPPTVPGTSGDPAADGQLVEGLIAGDLDAATVFPSVAWSSGFPIASDDGVWFVHWYEGGDWSVAGDFNGWEPQPMESHGDVWAVFVPDLDLSELTGTGYKFVNGGSEWVADPWSRAYTYDDNGQLSYLVAPTETWHLERWPGVEGEGLVPRDLRVYVPAGEGPWPVLYAHDGQNLFDPVSIWGGWRMQDALAQVDGDMLVVGIDNTVDRMSEYTHVDDSVLGYDIVGEGDAYAALVHETVRPHIESTYGSTGHDGVMGSSLGGLISLHIAWAYPGEYDFVASLSGTLGWGRFERSEVTMEEQWLASPPADIRVYVDSGGSAGPDGACLDLDGDGFPEDDPDSSDNFCESRQFVDALAASGFEWEDTLFHWHDPDAPHAENAWAARVDLPLQLFVDGQ